MSPQARHAVEISIESHLAKANALIEWLDIMDDDAEAEPSFSEEDALLPSWMAGATTDHSGPGCPISDPDYGVDDNGEPEDCF